MYMLLQWKRKHHLLGIVILMQNLLWTVCWVHKVCEFWHHILQFASCFLPEVNIETLVTDQMSEFIKSLLYCVLSVYMWGKDASEADNLDKWDLILDFPSYLHLFSSFLSFFSFRIYMECSIFLPGVLLPLLPHPTGRARLWYLLLLQD